VIGVPWGLLEFVLRDTSADIFGRDTGLALLTIGIGVVGLAAWAWSRPARHDADLELPVG
jgi:hypothetical protein